MHIWPLWLLYVLGQVLYVVHRADMSVHSSATAGASYREWFSTNGITYLWKCAGGTVIFMLWLGAGTGGTVFARVLADAGGGFVTKYLPVPSVFTWEVAASALVFGLSITWAVDWAVAKLFPQTQREVPGYDSSAGLNRILQEKGITTSKEKTQ